MSAAARYAMQTEAPRLPVFLDRDSPVPLYHQISEQLAAAIRTGDLHPGDSFEQEVSLSERLEVSRPTVRRAMADLVVRGLLVRRRGVGTMVAPEVTHRHNDLSSLHQDLVDAGRSPSTRLLTVERNCVEPRAARMLQLSPHTSLLYLERLRLVDGKPLAILRNWLPPLMANLPVADLEVRGLYDVMRRTGTKPAVAHQTLGSRPAIATERELLQIGRYEPILTMTRQAFDGDGRPIEFGDHCYRADRYRFDMTVHAT